MVSVEVRGNNRVANNLRTIATAYPKRIDDITRTHVQRWRGDLKSKPYPARPSGSTYTRTGRLANSWGVSKQGPAKYSINNSAPYSKYVIDEDGQAWMHKGRWWTVQEVLAEKERRNALTNDLTKELKDMADGE